MFDQAIEPNGLVCTICRHTGKQCPAAIRLVRNLAQADAAARRTSPDFELTGTTRLEGCHETCTASFRLSTRGVELFCGVEPDADLNQLSAFAKQFLEEGAGNPALMACEAPLAFVTTICKRPDQGPRVLAEAS